MKTSNQASASQGTPANPIILTDATDLELALPSNSTQVWKNKFTTTLSTTGSILRDSLSVINQARSLSWPAIKEHPINTTIVFASLADVAVSVFWDRSKSLNYYSETADEVLAALAIGQDMIEDRHRTKEFKAEKESIKDRLTRLKKETVYNTTQWEKLCAAKAKLHTYDNSVKWTFLGVIALGFLAQIAFITITDKTDQDEWSHPCFKASDILAGIAINLYFILKASNLYANRHARVMENLREEKVRIDKVIGVLDKNKGEILKPKLEKLIEDFMAENITLEKKNNIKLELLSRPIEEFRTHASDDIFKRGLTTVFNEGAPLQIGEVTGGLSPESQIAYEHLIEEIQDMLQ
jgi:hypothetical protein